MQAIQLHATPYQDHGFVHTLGLQVETRTQTAECELDEALAVLLQAVRQSKNPHAMEALGTLLAYMESLEKSQTALCSAQGLVNLTNPITMSL